MSALTRSKPSFIIYRDDPNDAPATAQATEPTASATNNTERVTSPRPPLTTSTSFSMPDKENTAPYPTAAPAGKAKKPKASSKSAPTSPLASSSEDTLLTIRSALATKFVAPVSSKVKSSKSSKTASKSKSQSSTLKRSDSISSSVPATGTDSTSASTRPKVKRSASTSSAVKKSSSRTRVAALPSVLEINEEGKDGLTVADRRAKDLTQLPLADISAAFPTSAPPEGSVGGGRDVMGMTLSRKRSRTNSIVINTALESSTSLLQVDSTQQSTLALDQPESSNTCPSPTKKLRLSPVHEHSPMPALFPVSSQPTLVEEELEVVNREPTLIDLITPPSVSSI